MGNRTEEKRNGVETYYHYAPTAQGRTNVLTSVSSLHGDWFESFVPDGVGQTLADGRGSYTYTPTGLMATAALGSGEFTYRYDADDLRAVKTKGGFETRYYVYGSGGMLLTEAAEVGGGVMYLREYVYAGTRLIGELAYPSAPSVTRQPVSRSVPVDSEVTFVAGAQGYPIPTVQWEAWAKETAAWQPLLGETSPTLVLIATADRDGQQFRAVFSNSGGSIATNAATLTLSVFTDDPPVAGVTLLKALHITELRVRIDAQRTRFGLSTFTWTDATLQAGTTPVRLVHMSDLRTALGAAYAAAGQSAPTYTDPELAAGVTVVKAVHVTELRAAVIVLERLPEPGGHALNGVATPSDPVVRYYHVDALGSVRAVSDGTGALISRHDFLPFGEEWQPEPTSPDQRLFTGKERDVESGLDYFGARYLRADLGRFTSRISRARTSIPRTRRAGGSMGMAETTLLHTSTRAAERSSSMAPHPKRGKENLA